MPRLPRNIRADLLKSGQALFLAHGYEAVSLREICMEAVLTTVAFYDSFSCKQDLFACLVEPILQVFGDMYRTVIARELDDQSTGIGNELTFITYAIEHRDKFRLLFDCSRGTLSEGFKYRLMQEVFYPSCQVVFGRYTGRRVDPALVRIILRMKFEEYMEVIYGEFTWKKSEN